MPHTPCVRFAIFLLVMGTTSLSAEQQKRTPTVAELQQKIIDLQAQLLVCQGAVQQRAPKEASGDTLKEAIEAFQTFNSTIDIDVNWATYRDALVPLKVTIDRLPTNDATQRLKGLLEVFVDAGHLWNMSITQAETVAGTSIRGVPTAAVSPYQIKYPEIWKSVAARGRSAFKDLTFDDYVQDFAFALVTKGRGEVQGVARVR